MSDADDIAINLAREFHKRKRLDGAALTISVSTLIAIISGAWWARGVIEDIRSDIRSQAQDTKYLREHVDAIEKEAIEAKSEGQEAMRCCWGNKGGYPK
jgi:hypothetical protein